VTPRVHGNVMLGHVLALEEERGGNGARANDKEGGLEGFLVQIAQEVGSVECGSVVIRETPCVLSRARRNISATNATPTRPPATVGICDSSGVCRAPSSYSGVEVWDLNAGRCNLGNPLLNLRAVGGRNGIKLRVISGGKGCD